MRLLYPLALLLLILIPLLVAALVVGRRRPGVRRIVPLVLRIVAIAALVFVVAGLQQSDAETGMDVVFALDVSDSVGPDGAREARVFVDGTFRGNTPIELELIEGEHSIRVTAPGHHEQVRTVTSTPGQIDAIDVTLEALPEEL
ncbi:MAG: PEGA domain-containing protein, partial [Spirochaetota bacterium]